MSEVVLTQVESWKLVYNTCSDRSGPQPKFAQNQPGFSITFFPKMYIIILENEIFSSNHEY